jgi:hypothetical protein
MWRPSHHTTRRGARQVYHATEGCDLVTGATLREKKKWAARTRELEEIIWQVRTSGEAELNNAHGLPRDQNERSCVPLKATDGTTLAWW